MRRLVVLRPEPGASATVGRAAAIGLDALAMPLFAIEPVEWDVPDPTGFDALLLTSANAVGHGGAGLERLRRLPVHAVGEATAAAARDGGFTIAGTGKGGVEQLRDGIPVAARLLHLCGEHRIPIDRGQTVTEVPVYRSVALPPPSAIRQIEGQAVAIHSPRAGQRLAEVADQAGVDRSKVRIAAISGAAADSVGGGWERCEAAAVPEEAALLALAARLCDNRLYE